MLYNKVLKHNKRRQSPFTIDTFKSHFRKYLYLQSFFKQVFYSLERHLRVLYAAYNNLSKLIGLCSSDMIFEFRK